MGRPCYLAGPVLTPPASIDRLGLALALALGLILSVAVCWDALAAGGGRIVGANDTEVWTFLWGHAWTAHALLEEGRFPLHTTWIDFPQGGTLWLKDSFSTTLLLPVTVLWGPEDAFDLSVLMHLSLATIGAFLWCRELGASRLLSLLLAPAFAFCPHTLGEAYNGNIEAISTAFTPLWLWALVRVARAPSWPRVATGAVCLGLLVWTNQYWTIAMALASPFVLALVLWEQRATGPGTRRRLLAVTGTVVAGAALSTPTFLALYASMRAEHPLTLMDTGSVFLAEPYLTDLKHYIEPLARLQHSQPTTLQDLPYPGWLLVLTASAAPLLRPRSGWSWLLAGLGLFTLVLTVGPALSWEGQVLRDASGRPYWLPWAWLATTPVWKGMTLPHRMAVPALAFLVGAAALTLQELVRRWPRAGTVAGAVVAVACLVEIAVVPGYDLPLRTTRLGRPAHALLLAEAPGDGAVLNLPQALNLNRGRQYLWFQALHGRATSQTLRHGEIADAGRSVHIVATSASWERQLLDGTPPEELVATHAYTSAQLQASGFGYVVMHPDIIEDFVHGQADDHGRAWVQWASLVLPELGPAVQLPDGRLVVTIDADQRDAVIALARARWGDEVRVIDHPDEVAVYGPWLDSERRRTR